MEVVKIFNSEGNSAVIKSAFDYVKELGTADEFERTRNAHILMILNSMQRNGAQWDAGCQANIGWIGTSFISSLSKRAAGDTKEYLDHLYAYCLRFLMELYLSIEGELNPEFDRARVFGGENINNFTSDAQAQINYATTGMVISIIRSLVNSDGVKGVKRFEIAASNAEARINELTKEMAEKERRVNLIKESLDKYEKAFNFVGLYQGFDELSVSKNDEKNSILKWIKVFGVLVLMPITLEMYFLSSNIERAEDVKAVVFFSFIPVLTMSGIFVYYFRILLGRYMSVKSQLLQIELRKTLCRFIQSYAEYSVEIKSKDKETLAKFESIVFSGLVSDDEKLPSTFDGLEQISNIIKTIKS